jgi:hypothetical protein
VIKGVLISSISSGANIFSIWDSVFAITHNMLQNTWTEVECRLEFVVAPGVYTLKSAKVCCTKKKRCSQFSFVIMHTRYTHA